MFAVLNFTALLFLSLRVLGGVAEAPLCTGEMAIDGLARSYLMGVGGSLARTRLQMHQDSSFTVTKSCQNSDNFDPFGYQPIELLGKTLSFTVDLRHVGCGCNVALYLVQSPARDEDGRPSKGSVDSHPFYCDAGGAFHQLCPELDIMEANKHVFAATPHKCDKPSSGHYSKCDHKGCERTTKRMGGDAYGPSPAYKINTLHPFTVHATFHGSGPKFGGMGASFTGMTIRLQQGSNEVILDFTSCGTYLGEIAEMMAEGMTMRLAYWGSGKPQRKVEVEHVTCEHDTCQGGDAVISNIRITSSCARELSIAGMGEATYVAGDNGVASGDRLELHHESGYSVMNSCEDHWDPNGFTMFKLLGRTLSFTVDVSQVGCGCNMALYLIHGPARDKNGNPSLGTCSYSPYYCDANKVCGQWCPEVDIMEANSRAYASTPHKCDAPSSTGHYSNCDRNGCGQSTRGLDSLAYGPGAGFRINTMRPFEIAASFHAAPNADGNAVVFAGMTVKLKQERNEIILDHSNCRSYLASLTGPMMEGMLMRITYWGNDAETMSWLDQPPCGEQSCKGLNAGPGVLRNVTLSNLSGWAQEMARAGSAGQLGGPASAGVAPSWVLLFALLSLMQCSFLLGLTIYAMQLYRRWHPAPEPGTPLATPMVTMMENRPR